MAERLLKENKLTIGEIALQIGYQNPNKFTSAFRTEYGMTPTEYRKKKTQESLNGQKKVKRVTLQTNPFYEGRLPEVSDFIKKYKDRYEGFQINVIVDGVIHVQTRVNIASARLVMLYENGKSEIVK